jgi:hypothetical protein
MGLEAWAQDKAKNIKDMYFNGKWRIWDITNDLYSKSHRVSNASEQFTAALRKFCISVPPHRPFPLKVLRLAGKHWGTVAPARERGLKRIDN